MTCPRWRHKLSHRVYNDLELRFSGSKSTIICVIRLMWTGKHGELQKIAVHFGTILSLTLRRILPGGYRRSSMISICFQSCNIVSHESVMILNSRDLLLDICGLNNENPEDRWDKSWISKTYLCDVHICYNLGLGHSSTSAITQKWYLNGPSEAGLEWALDYAKEVVSIWNYCKSTQLNWALRVNV